MFEVHQQVIAKIKRCACVGGGYAEIIGTIIGIINAPNGKWYQVAYEGGISTVKETDIIKVLT